MMESEAITPELVETIDYAYRNSQYLQSISIDVHAIVLILIFICGSAIAYIILKLIKSIIN